MESRAEKQRILDKQAELVRQIEHHANTDGSHLTAIPTLHFTRTSYREGPVFDIQGPALCIIVQGEKRVLVGEDTYDYDPFHYLVVSLDLPYTGQIVQADEQCPLLCMSLEIEPEVICDIVQNSGSSYDHNKSSRGMFVGDITHPILDACCRLVSLLDTPQDIPSLSILIIREIFYRILQTEQGSCLKQIGISASHTSKIAEITSLMKRDFAKPMRMGELAQTANMSLSSLYRHFKEVTAMSPLQYQKQLRLQEARRLLLSSQITAADAGFLVGYESPSQFNREYARMFGLPPKRDAKHLRA